MNSHHQGKGSYGRLPRGPHALDPAQVAFHQRQRLIDAMIELVGERGYAPSTVAHLIEHAGISRRTFYERFENRAELLLAAFDAIEAIAPERTRSLTSPAEALADRLCRLAEARDGAVSIAAVEVAAAGPDGMVRRNDLMSGCGALLAREYGHDGSWGLPFAVCRAVAGAMYRTVLARTRDRGECPASQLARWARSYRPPPHALAPLAGASLSTADLLGGGRAPGTLTPVLLQPRCPQRRPARSFDEHTDCERIFDAVAQLNSRLGYIRLTAKAIAEHAGLSDRAFQRHFADKHDAFAATLELGHSKALAVVERAGTGLRGWTSRTCAATRALIEFLTREPLFTRMALVDASLAGVPMARRAHRYVCEYAQLLFEGAPPGPLASPLCAQATVYALFELAFPGGVGDGASGLDALAPQAVYVALAPLIGSGRAATIAFRRS